MTDVATTPTPIVDAARLTLTPLGDPAAASCVGDVCEIPDHHTQAVINRKLDSDAV
jgi:hypothetical protein